MSSSSSSQQKSSPKDDEYDTAYNDALGTCPLSASHFSDGHEDLHLYDLYAVVNHTGHLHSGHYFSHVLTEEETTIGTGIRTIYISIYL